MKKRYLLLLALTLLLSGTATIWAEPPGITEADTCYASFDLNGDGYAPTIGDMVMLIRYWNEGIPAIEPLYQADLTGDCVIDGNDLEALNCFFIHGIVPCFPIWPVPTCCEPDTVVGACCLGDSCSIRSSEHCADIGGEYLGDFTSCYPENLCLCCKGIRGNVDADPEDLINVADLTYLVAFLFVCGFPDCEDEENVNGLLGPGGNPTDIADLTYLVAYLFNGGPSPPLCP
ncbi:MAG: hypothetical protein KOO62_00015 [candidate division Zixibacteria bacterium]|nr:hypothetical protein [candidate division Zixibacteria bacterium]